jgi:hypothetical protein
MGISAPVGVPGSSVDVGGDDVERDRVVGREDRERIGTDLVRRVTVRRDPVGPREHVRDLAAGHEQGRRGVRYDRVGDSRPFEFPGGQAAPLEQRAGLVYEHLPENPTREGRPEGPDRAPVAAGREAARIAVRERARARAEQVGRVLAHLPAALHLLFVDLPGSRARIDGAANLAERPGEVHRRGAGRKEDGDGLVEILPTRGGEGVPVGGGDADRRSAAHGHQPDRLGDLGGRAARELDRLAGKAALVEEDDTVLLEAQDLVRV